MFRCGGTFDDLSNYLVQLNVFKKLPLKIFLNYQAGLKKRRHVWTSLIQNLCKLQSGTLTLLFDVELHFHYVGLIIFAFLPQCSDVQLCVCTSVGLSYVVFLFTAGMCMCE